MRSQRLGLSAAQRATLAAEHVEMRERTVDFSWIFERLPRRLPPPWHEEERREDGARFVKAHRRKKRQRSWHRIIMTVVLSGCVEQDNRRWLHLSVSRPNQLPSWDDLVTVKELFLGRESRAIQVIPPRSQHVNIHPHCLHLFECVDEDVLPDFRSEAGLI